MSREFGYHRRVIATILDASQAQQPANAFLLPDVHAHSECLHYFRTNTKTFNRCYSCAI